MQSNAKLYVISDSQSYIRHILKSINQTKDLFFWVNQSSIYLSLKDYFNIETKFYKKAIFQGKKPSLFILKKI